MTCVLFGWKESPCTFFFFFSSRRYRYLKMCLNADELFLLQPPWWIESIQQCIFFQCSLDPNPIERWRNAPGQGSKTIWGKISRECCSQSDEEELSLIKSMYASGTARCYKSNSGESKYCVVVSQWVLWGFFFTIGDMGGISALIVIHLHGIVWIWIEIKQKGK